MDPMLSLVLKFLLVTVTFSAIFIGHKYFKMKSGNVAEKIVEEVVEKETGVDVASLENAAEAIEDQTTPPASSGDNKDNSPSK